MSWKVARRFHSCRKPKTGSDPTSFPPRVSSYTIASDSAPITSCSRFKIIQTTKFRIAKGVPMKTSKTDSPEPYLTPPEIAKLLRVSSEKVLDWIREAELRAINVSEGFRPRYRIRREDFDLFLRSREVQPPAPRTTRTRRSSPPPEGGPIDPALGEQLAKNGQARKVGKHYYRIWNGVTQFF